MFIKEVPVNPAQSCATTILCKWLLPLSGEILNISGIVVHAHPQHQALVSAALAQLPGVEIHATSPDHKLVVTIEADDDRATTDCFETIRQLPGVLSASMVYHHFEDSQSLEQEIQP